MKTRCWDWTIRALNRLPSLEVSRSGYYAWLNRPPSERATENERIAQQIKQHWEDSRKTYGLPRLQRKLKDEGINIGKSRI